MDLAKTRVTAGYRQYTRLDTTQELRERSLTRTLSLEVGSDVAETTERASVAARHVLNDLRILFLRSRSRCASHGSPQPPSRGLNNPESMTNFMTPGRTLASMSASRARFGTGSFRSLFVLRCGEHAREGPLFATRPPTREAARGGCLR